MLTESTRRSDDGSLFQVRGAATANERSPMLSTRFIVKVIRLKSELSRERAREQPLGMLGHEHNTPQHDRTSRAVSRRADEIWT